MVKRIVKERPMQLLQLRPVCLECYAILHKQARNTILVQCELALTLDLPGYSCPGVLARLEHKTQKLRRTMQKQPTRLNLLYKSKDKTGFCLQKSSRLKDYLNRIGAGQLYEQYL